MLQVSNESRRDKFPDIYAHMVAYVSNNDVRLEGRE